MAKPDTMPKLSFRDALASTFKEWFTPLSTWAAWLVLAKAAFAEPLTPEELDVFRRFTGRDTAPTKPVRELYIGVGRRGGKSYFAAALATYAAAFRKYPTLKKGQRGVVMILATDRDQAKEVFRYICAFFDEEHGAEILKPMVESLSTESLLLTNGIEIVVQTANFRRVRGRTVVCAILDEIAFWFSDEESANPDREIVKALKPSMLTIPNAIMVAISSPYAKKGVLWDAYKKFSGKDVPGRLYWKGGTLDMNPAADRAQIEEDYLDDPEAAASELGGEFRDDVSMLVSHEVLTRAIEVGVGERLYVPGLVYHGFVDASGGGGDRYTGAIAHIEGDRQILDAVREYAADTSPDSAAEQNVEWMIGYGISTVWGDNYAKLAIQESYERRGMRYRVTKHPKAALYLKLLALLNNGTCSLLDVPRLTRQILALERHTRSGGNDKVDVPRGGHEDLANAAAGALVTASISSEITARNERGLGSAADDYSWRPDGFIEKYEQEKAIDLEAEILELHGAERGAHFIALAKAAAEESKGDVRAYLEDYLSDGGRWERGLRSLPARLGFAD